MKAYPHYILAGLFLFIIVSCSKNTNHSSSTQPQPHAQQNKIAIADIRDDKDVAQFIKQNFAIGDKQSGIEEKLSRYGFKTYEQDSSNPNIKQYYHIKETKVSMVLVVKVVIFTQYSNQRLTKISGHSGLIGL